MNKTISVIIPVYNVAAYLPECMDSLLSQSYRDLEIWLIDDGSTDECPALCDKYAAQDSRVHVIHQPNGGAASAKNAGLRAATGYYLTFLDSDDYLEPGAYKHMVSTLEHYNVDVVQCAFRDVYVESHQDYFISEEMVEYSVVEYLKRYTMDWTCGLMTDKLFKRALFHDIFFEEGHCIDDEYFTYRGVMNATKILYSPHVVYNYRKRKSSVMLSPTSAEQIVMDRLDYLSKRRLNIRLRFPDLQPVFDDHYLNMLLILSKDAALTVAAAKTIKQLIKAWFSERNTFRLPLGLIVRLRRVQFQRVSTMMKSKVERATKDMSHTNCFD